MRRSLLISATLILLLIGAVMHAMPEIRMSRSAYAADGDATELDIPPGKHAVFSRLLFSIGIDNPSGEITAQDVFGDTPKNLYIYTYQEIFERPEQEAMNDLASAYGLTPTDARAVLQGSTAPLMRGKVNYAQDKAVADVTKVQRSYAEILKRRKMKYQLQLTVLPTEIFANGNLDDSGFDLIHDLNLIEEVLFIDKTKVYLNQQPFGAKKFSLEKKNSEASVVTSGSSLSSNGTTGSVSDSSSGSTVESAGQVNTYTLDDILAGTSASGGSLNYCASGSPLNKALEAYEKKGSGTGSAPSTTKSDTTTKITSTMSSVDSVDIAAIPPPELAQVPVTAAGVFAPPTESFCNEIGGTLLYTYRTKIGGTEHEIFCMSLDKKVRTYTSFSPEKSCIQCTVAAMNENMKKLLSKNITPNKLTGNTYESTKCKSAIQLSDRLNINIIMVPTPIITPSKYGPFVVGDIGKRLNAYVRNYLPYGDPKDSPPERVKDEAVANSGKGGDQVNVLDQIQSKLAANSKDIADKEAMKPIEEATSVKNASYQQMIKEMRLMTSYFQSFHDIFVRLGTTTNKICDKKDINS